MKPEADDKRADWKAQDQDELIRRANLYPKLVEALRELVLVTDGYGKTYWDCMDKARALLKECGE
jgi:hypothetical protein